MPARLRTTLLTFACTLAATLAPAAVAGACTGADADPTKDARSLVETATVCLLNVERSARGLAPVTYDATLSSVAQGHAQDMLDRHYFAHVSPDGGTLTDRLRAGRWIPENSAWTAGENIAWGQSYLGTPREIMKAWMNSPGHKANILEPDFVEIGIATLPGAPNGAGDAGTYVTNFGWRESGADATDSDAPAASVARTVTKKKTTRMRCARYAKKSARSSRKSRSTRRCVRYVRSSRTRRS